VDDDAHVVPDDAPLPDEILLALEEEHIVRTAVAALDARCRRLLTLLFYRAEPPSYAEVARELGIREGSVGPTRARCLQKVLAVLQAAEF
jgi:RNA polymerase sigma factor (sigma-70 family)